MIDPATNRSILADGKYLRLVKVGAYEYVERTNISGIVTIVAVTDQGRLLLTEQHRWPFNRAAIELPAGLAGDVVGEEDELLETAAMRELLEETGYQADSMVRVAEGTTSPGLCTELLTVFRAAGLRKVAAGGGVDHEDIRVHEVPLDQLFSWLETRRQEGKLIDLKIYAAPAWAAAG